MSVTMDQEYRQLIYEEIALAEQAIRDHQALLDEMVPSNSPTETEIFIRGEISRALAAREASLTSLRARMEQNA